MWGATLYSGIPLGWIVMLLTSTSLEINIFGVPDTMSCTNQNVFDIKEIAINLYRTMTVTGRLFQDLLVH